MVVRRERSKWGLWVKHNDIVSPSAENGFKELYSPVSESFPSFEKISSVSLKMIIDDNLSKAEPSGDKHDEIHLLRGDRSDLDLQPKGKLAFHGPNTDLDSHVMEKKTKTDEGITLGEMIVSGNTIDSWMLLKTFMESPLLKCSCSHIEIKQVKQLIKSPERSSSYNNLQNLCGNGKVECTCGPHISPLSVWTSHIADVVMLKRCYSIHVLPSRSRKIWWKHFLWSHGNLHRSSAPENLLSAVSDANKKDGYLYDMHASDQRFDNMKNKAVEIENQWTAFSLQSSHMDRVSAWANNIADEHGMEIGEFSVKKYFDTCQRETVDFGQANNIIQSLNSFSSVARMRGIGLKVVPSISGFLYLRSANLSGNCIVQITPGSLPKSLHTLDLSRNKISTIEGIRHLEKLRVLNLSFNRISRISHGAQLKGDRELHSATGRSSLGGLRAASLRARLPASVSIPVSLLQPCFLFSIPSQTPVNPTALPRSHPASHRPQPRYTAFPSFPDPVRPQTASASATFCFSLLRHPSPTLPPPDLLPPSPDSLPPALMPPPTSS
ncbi:hypothetical protein KSP39_PZI003462 [Platanthera zijinensis]|uniref:Uncharacterized protein n=1 Tax=Platanthera zijinensis TaxID=2320716 RepID=A0AAP0BY19_9ASPA